MKLEIDGEDIRSPFVFLYSCFVFCFLPGKMMNDEFEKEFAASMDDLEEIDTINTITIPPPASATALTTSKLAKFKRLPEIAENIATTTVSPSPVDLLYRVPTDVLAASVGGDLRKTVLINNSANEILSSSPLSSATILNEFERQCDTVHSDVANNNFTNGNKSNDNLKADKKHDNDDDEGGEVKAAAPRRKFIVTRMDSKVLLRPEAEQLRNLSAKTNAATISFPCSSAINRTPLTSLFASNRSFEPHLDKRFFDTSLVRINANSSQSLNASNASSQENSLNVDADIWERRKQVGLKPTVQVIVSSAML